VNRFGLLAQSREQTVASNWFGLCLLCALAGLAGRLWNWFQVPALMAALAFGFLLLPVAVIFRCPSGWQRNTMAGLTICLALCGVAAILVTARAVPPGLRGTEGGDRSGWGLLGIVLIGAAGSTWLTNIFRSRQPRR
jgi:hypothetical protein